MKFTFNKTKYNEKEKEWIEMFENSRKDIILKSKFDKNKMIENTDFLAFDYFFNENAMEFFLKEYINFQLNKIHSSSNKNKKDQNDIAKVHLLKKNNGEVASEGFNKIKELKNYYPKYEKSIINILSTENNLKKINEIAIDRDLNNITIFFIDNDINIDHNKLLNLSIRNGNQEVFEKIISNFNGKKENYENLSDSPFFWQPLLFNKNKDFSPKYIYDQLLDHNFKIGKIEIIKMIELSKLSPQKLKFYHDLDKRIDNKSTIQRSLKF